MLQIDTAWTSQDDDETTGIAWGDVDGDGDLDLAVSNDHGVDKIYFHREAGLEEIASWESVDDARSTSLAWGDLDGDGDLDLVVGVFGRANLLYENKNGGLLRQGKPVAADEDETYSVAWGDVDGDGNLDLAVGNRGTPNKIYRNDAGMLNANAIWYSTESDATMSIAWGDWDDDGDLDLAAGNRNQPNRVYRNVNGELAATALWSSTELDDTRAVAWGDWDGDGDLDLAVGNFNTPNRIYHNQQDRGEALPYAIIESPQSGAYFFAAANIESGEQLTVTYKLFNPAGPSLHQILPQYASGGSNLWQPLTAVDPRQLRNRSASSTGVTHAFQWQIPDDVIREEQLRLRLLVLPASNHTPLLWPATATTSRPFRYAAPWYAKVLDELGNPVQDATVVLADDPTVTSATEIVTTASEPSQTDRAGLIRLPPLTMRSQLVALAKVAEYPSLRANHDRWAYRVYTTNIRWTPTSDAQVYTVANAGEQRITLNQQSPLILFNLLISIEWDADASYLAEIEAMVRSGSDYLYDLTDGQMALGTIKIYDKANFWEDADVRIFAKNRTQPHAAIGAILAEASAGAIHLGRHWDRDRGTGQWSAPDGYRTFIHEFGHYALYLYDEYFVRIFDENNKFVRRQEAFCVENKKFMERATGDAETLQRKLERTASSMYWQYAATELSATGISGLWSPPNSENCEWTEQWRRTARELKQEQGESTWETLARHYQDESGQNRWQIITPIDRGYVLTGPVTLPTALSALVTITASNDSAVDVPNRQLLVDASGTAGNNAFVTLLQDGRLINQGFTDSTGAITLYGARPGDRIQVVSRDKQFAKTKTIGSENPVMIALDPITEQTAQLLGEQTAASDPFATAQLISTQSPQTIHAMDGLATLYLEPLWTTEESIDDMLIVMSDSAMQPVPANMALYSSIYTVQARQPSGQVYDEFPPQMNVVLEVHYSAEQMGTEQEQNVGSLQLYYYEAEEESWQLLRGNVDVDNQIVYASIRRPGHYALLQAQPSQAQPYQLYLPFIAQNPSSD